MKRRPEKAKSSKPRPPAAPAGSAPVAAPSASARRKWLFRLIALVFVPLLLLGVLEAALRVAGCGYRTGFFTKVRLGAGPFLVNNETFSLRFFPPELARWPEPIMIAAAKPAGTFRIFVLGESAARGEPEPPYGAGRFLEALLKARFPGASFEVVNVSITAINSNVILPIARDCAGRDGDVWIVYMGNNEMVGPFGAATVFGSKAPPLGLIRLNLAIQRTRLGQAVMALSRAVKGKPQNAAWGGMQMFLANQLAPDDPSRETVYRNFDRNLQDIVRVGMNSGAKVVLSTVAVNLKDCPPFASLPVTNLAAADRAVFDRLYTNACSAAERSDFAAAASMFAQASRLAPKVPDVEFRRGDCLLRLNQPAAAREHFQLACDYDALPFRATSRINGLIREAGRRFAGTNLVLLDAVAALETNSPAGICGQEFFYEHVHFNFDGQYRLGRAWADAVERFLPATIRSRTAGDWASQADCERRLGLTDWNRAFVVESVLWRLRRPPMSGQLNNAARLAALQRVDQDLRRAMNPGAEAGARAVYEAAIRSAPADHYLHENFSEYLESAGDVRRAIAEWRQVTELLPFNCVGHYQAGRLLEKLDQWPEAEAALSRAVQLRPSLAEGWFELGCVRLAREKFDEALPAFGRARKLDPQNANYCAFVGKANSKLNRRSEAIENYREAIRLQPDFPEAHFALGDELVAAEKLGEAQREYEEVIRMQPTNALAHLDLGVMLARQGRADDALIQFAATLRLDPTNRQAQEYFERVQAWKKGRQP